MLLLGKFCRGDKNGRINIMLATACLEMLEIHQSQLEFFIPAGLE